VAAIFKKFATEIDKNTIKLGIPAIDNKVRVTTSMLVGLLAAPSAGKTSVSLSILNEASRSNIKSVFFSLDMGAPLVLQRLIQKHARLNSKTIYSMYQNSDNEIGKIETTLDSEYKNVSFCFKSGITTQDIRDYIVKEQEASEEKVRLVVVDYLECLQGPYSDATANTSIIAQQLKDIANDLEVCIVLLLQPQKHAGDPSSELLSYRNIKGSSAVEQAASVIFTMWRPGFSPKNPVEDKYLSMAVVKNRMGSLDLFEFSWDGLTGELTELDELQQGELNALKKRKAAEKAANDI
jgi:replicative DNA helicase